MLKQSSSRNQRPKGLKIKYALQTCLLLAIGIWMLHQLKLFLNNKATNRDTSSFGRPENVQNEKEHFKYGRKSLFQREQVDSAHKGKSQETKHYSSSEIEEDRKRDGSSGMERETEDEEPERIEDLLDENSEEFDGSEEQEEAFDSLESSFDLVGNKATIEHRSLVGTDDFEEKNQDHTEGQ